MADVNFWDVNMPVNRFWITAAVLAALAATSCSDRATTSGQSSATADSVSESTEDSSIEAEGTEVEGEEAVNAPWDFQRDDLPDYETFELLVATVDEAAKNAGVSVVLLDPTTSDGGWHYKFDGVQVVITNGTIMVVEQIAASGVSQLAVLRDAGFEVAAVTVKSYSECGLVELADRGAEILQCRIGQTDVAVEAPTGVELSELTTVAERAAEHMLTLGAKGGSTGAPGLSAPDPFADALTPFVYDKVSPFGTLATEYASFDDVLAAVREQAKSGGVQFTGYDVTAQPSLPARLFVAQTNVIALSDQVLVVESYGSSGADYLQQRLVSVDGTKVTSHFTDALAVTCLVLLSDTRSSLVCSPQNVTIAISVPSSTYGSVELAEEGLISKMKTILDSPVQIS